MSHRVQLTFQGLEPSDALRRQLQAQATDLATIDDTLLSCQFQVTPPHAQRSSAYAVRLHLGFPDQELVIDNPSHPNQKHLDLDEALHRALQAAGHRLQHKKQAHSSPPRVVGASDAGAAHGRERFGFLEGSESDADRTEGPIGPHRE